MVLCGGYSRQSCGANAVLRVIGERCFLGVRSVCGGVGLYRFRTALVEVACLFIWVKMPCICFRLYTDEQRQLLKVCPIKEERLVSQGMAACSPFPRILTLLYIGIQEPCILSALFRPILGKEKSYRTEKGFKCSGFESLPRLRTFPAL